MSSIRLFTSAFEQFQISFWNTNQGIMLTIFQHQSNIAYYACEKIINWNSVLWYFTDNERQFDISPSLKNYCEKIYKLQAFI